MSRKRRILNTYYIANNILILLYCKGKHYLKIKNNHFTVIAQILEIYYANIYLSEYRIELGVVVPEYNDCGHCPIAVV